MCKQTCRVKRTFKEKEMKTNENTVCVGGGGGEEGTATKRMYAIINMNKKQLAEVVLSEQGDSPPPSELNHTSLSGMLL